MEDIKVNEYVRDCEGNIERIINVINGDLYIGDYGNSYPRNCITKHSFNIIDLIETNDIIIYNSNYLGREIKMEVNYTCKKEDDYKWGEGYVDTVIDEYITIEDIKSIVTKEQFNSIKYEV